MRQRIVMFTFALSVCTASLAAAATASPRFIPATHGGVPDEYIAVLKEMPNQASTGRAPSTPTVGEICRRLGSRYGGIVKREWEVALRGCSLKISEAAARKLTADPAVAYVEQNIFMSTAAIPSCDSRIGGVDGGSPSWLEEISSPQTIHCDDPDPRDGATNCVGNWGLSRIDEAGSRDGLYKFSATGAGVHVYTIDYGIHKDHREFWNLSTPVPHVSRVKEGYNAARVSENLDDCNGHGTHVAGIIAGTTFGVAKEAILHPVKFADACDRNPGQSPFGNTSADVIEGINWIIPHHQGLVAQNQGPVPAVVNFSGGNGSDSTFRSGAVRDAVLNLLNDGIVFVQSAGNQNDQDSSHNPINACIRTLAQYPELRSGLIVVGGIDENTRDPKVYGRWIREQDDPATPQNDPDPSYQVFCSQSPFDCGSNTGSCVDIWAPGAHIVSASKESNEAACRLSGTSMAAPHVTGAVALYLQNHRSSTPAQTKQALLAGATTGVLNDNPASLHYIRSGSPNLLLNTSFATPVTNLAPTPADDSYSTLMNTSFQFLASDLLINDTDPDNDQISFDGFVTFPTHGVLSVDGVGPTDIIYSYTPNAGYIGSDSFEYRVADPGGLTGTATVSITINTGTFSPKPDFFTTPAGTLISILSTQLTANDGSGAHFIRAENPRHGTLDTAGVGPGDVKYNFTPEPGFAGEAGFDYLVSSNGSEPYTRVSVTITVTDWPPSATLMASCTGLSCSFSATDSTDDIGIVSYSWNLGDGTTFSDVSTTKTYTVRGDYTVTLTVTDGRGQSDTVSRLVSVDGLPTASFSANCLGATCSFDATGSTDDTGIASYAWDFGDGATGSGVTPSHTYASGGDRTVTLTVTDIFGQSVSTTRTVHVDLPPIASFTKSCSGLTCSFNASSSSDDFGITTYAWSFGDATTGSGVTASHTYAARGTYTVVLTVTDTAGQTATASQSVTVDALPVAAFTVNCTGRTCTFDASGSTDDVGISAYSWSFGDGQTGTGITVTHTYTASGSFVVTLAVADTISQTATTTRTVVIDVNPTACFTVVRDGLVITFNASCSTDDLGIVSYAWSFGDATTGTGQNISHTYATSGSRIVQLTVTDTGGHTATTSQTVNPDAKPVANFTASCVQRTCSFNGTSSTDNQPIANYAWNFGDGTRGTGTGATPSHIYAVGGPYNVTLTVTDSVGQTNARTSAVAVNRPPVAVNDSASTPPNTAVDINVIANDTDPDLNTLTVKSGSLTAPAHGTVSLNTNGTVHYVPTTGYLGTDTFQYQAWDGQDGSNVATVTVTTNNPPDARDDGWSTYQNGPTNIPFSHMLANDYDPNGDVLTVTDINTTGLTGTLDCSSGTYCRFTPPSWFVGTTSFTYNANDGKGGADPATVRIKVGVANGLPTPQDDILETAYNTPLTFTRATLLLNDSDPNGDVLSVPWIYRAPLTALGTVSCSAANYVCTYTPPAGFTGVDVLWYRASDGIDFFDARIRILVRPPSPAVLDAHEDQKFFTTAGGTFLSYTWMTSNDYDPEGGALTVMSVDTTGLLGTLDCTTDSSGCQYTPGTSSATRFRYTVRDPQGNLATTTVTLKPGNWSFNLAPVIANDQLSTRMNTPLSFSIFDVLRNDYDLDNDQLTVSFYFASQYGRVSCTTPAYFCTYTPNANFTGTDTLTYYAHDGNNSGSGSVTVTVQPLLAKDTLILSQSVPVSMFAGQSYPVSVRLKNVGTQTWSPVGPQCSAFRLGSANPYNNATWGLTRMELPGPIAPGGEVTLSFTATAPPMPGTYNFQWRMVHECVEWFGDFTPNVAVTVSP